MMILLNSSAADAISIVLVNSVLAPVNFFQKVIRRSVFLGQFYSSFAVAKLVYWSQSYTKRISLSRNLNTTPPGIVSQAGNHLSIITRIQVD
jgi:hypothetical protein